MRHVIRVGDQTVNSRCTVLRSSASQFQVDGVAVALVGDKLSCRCVIVEGDTNHRVNGVAVAFDGCKTSCGDVLRASSKQYGTTP